MSTLMKEVDHEAELARLARYVASEMSEAEVEQFKTELVADEEFFDRMAPLLAVFFPREPLPAQQRAIDAMRAEAAHIREADMRRKEIRKYIAGALGSLLAVKPLVGTLAVAATAVIAALVLPNDRPSDTLSKPSPTLAIKTVPPSTTPTKVATAAPAIVRSTPTVPTLRAFVLPPVDTAAERAVDSMLSTPLGMGLAATTDDVVATGPVAPPLKPVPTLAWAVSPSDTITPPLLDTRKGVRATVNGWIHGRILGKIFGRPKQPLPPVTQPPAHDPSGGIGR
jgi:hypothetical protein